MYIANGEEPLVEEEENPKEEKSDPEASEADTDLCKEMSKHMFLHKMMFRSGYQRFFKS